MDRPSPVGARGPVSGVGIGLRGPHIQALLAEPPPPVAWLELLADNHLNAGGVRGAALDALCGRYPVTLHGVGMNLGGLDPLDPGYLRAIRDLRDRTGAAWVSDHLCFTRHGRHHYHDLLPLPGTAEAVHHVAARIRAVQDYLGAPLVVENVSAYVLPAEAELDEGGFISAVVAETGCAILLDVNNLYVSQVNLGTDARQLISALPLDAVREIHVAGHATVDGFLVDAHNQRVSDPVWSLLGHAAERLPGVPVLVEWDDAIPGLPVLLDEAARARRRVAAASHAA